MGVGQSDPERSRSPMNLQRKVEYQEKKIVLTMDWKMEIMPDSERRKTLCPE